MKRNTLYTVNKANQPAFMYRENRNLFKLGGETNPALAAFDKLASQKFGENYGEAGSTLSDYMNSKNAFGISKADNPFSKGNLMGAFGLGAAGGAGGGIGGALKGAVGSMGGMSGIASAVGGAVGNLIGGGYSSGVGNVMGSLGKVASVIPGPYGAAISAGLQVLGGGVNRLFGSKVDAVRLGKANEEMNKLNSFTSNASSLDDIKSREATASVAGIYQGGVWNKSAKKQQEELEEQMRDARQFADRSIGNNVNNLVSDMANEALANYSAYGGPLGDSFGGALGLMQQNKYIDAINNRSNAITKGLEAIAQQQPTTFTNRFDAGGFVDNFMQDPVAAAMNYIQQRDAEEAQAEAQAAQEAREQEFNNLQTRLMNAETQNQGLQALLEDQGRSIASLQEAQNAALFTPSSAASDSSSDDWKTSAIATAREVAGDDNYSSLKNFIKGQEGFRSKAYWLKGEKAPTIGYGFHMVYPGTSRPVRMGDTMTQEEAEQGLTTVLRGIDRDLSKKVPNWDKLTSYQRDALRDLAYGTGTGGAHFRKNSKLMTALRNEDWEEAERNLVSRSIKNPQYNKALLRRSRQRQDMFREGKYAEGGKFGGGSFYGSGAGGGWDEPTSDTYNVGNFNQAFDAAVADGLKEFTFQGRRYNTQKETNPVREYNNRWVGQGRRANKKNPSKAYDHQAGPLGGPLADVPMVIDTYIGTPERPPQLDYNPDAMERGKALPYSWSHTVDRPMFITPKKAFGGELGTNGTDFTNGLLQVNAGNTHERNPFGGVPMGLDQQGIPNLVEEGETVFNDYVFSKRLKVPNFMLKDLGLPEIKSHGKRHKLSFADVSKKLAEESEKRPNDPISMNGLNASLSKLMEIQEAERMKEQAKQQSEEIDMASDDLALMAACGGKLNKYGLGGNLFDTGGKFYRGRRLPDQGAFESDSRYARKLEGLGYSDLEIDDIITEQGTRTSSTYHPRTKKFKNMGWHRADGKPLYSKEEVDREIDDFVHDKYKRVPKASSSSNATEAAKPVKQGKRTVYKSYSGKVFNTNAEAKADSQRYFADKRAAATQTPQQQAAPASSSTPSTAASNTSSTRSTARRSAAPATTRAAQSNIPAQSNFEAFREYRRNNPFEDTASQNDLVAAAQAMANANGMPLEVEGAALGTNTNPSNRRWNVGNYDWLSGDFNPSNTAGFIPYNRNMSADDIAREENSDRYKAWTDYVLNNWDNRDNTDVQNYLRELDTRAGGNHLFDADGNLREDARDYFQYARGVGNNSNHAWGYYHLTPTWADEVAGNTSNAATASNTPAQATSAQGNNGIVPVREEDYTLTEDELNAAGRRLDEQARQDWAGQGNRVNSPRNFWDRAFGTDEEGMSPTWMRYAPVVGAGIMSLTDALGLTNKPDYSGVSALEMAANRAAYAPNVKAPYIGDYMRYTPFDRLFYANQLQANSRATDRALMNTSAGNRGTAQAAMLANAYNTNNNLGNLYRQAEEYNRGQYERTKEFNRRTNMFNAQMGLEADMANARYTQQASQMGLHGLAQAAAMRDQIDARTGAARAANLSNFINGLGDIGRENFAFNQINSDRSRRHHVGHNGGSYDWIARAYQDGYEAALGGKLNKKNKGRRRG